MPRGIPRFNCRHCYRHVSECGKLSARGRCVKCGDERMFANLAAMRRHEGPFFAHWKARCLAALGVGLEGELDRERR